MKNYRRDFPQLHCLINNEPFIYFDNAATTLKPEQVIQALAEFYRVYNAPIHRGIYRLAETATQRHEAVREQVARFIGAQSPQEIVFTKGATEGINIVASSWAAHNLTEGDEILITEVEHHANILPWQRLVQHQGIVLRWIPLRADGTLEVTQLPHLLTAKTRLVALSHTSNVLGPLDNLVTPEDLSYLRDFYNTSAQGFLELIIQQAHNIQARVLVDAAQAVPHHLINLALLPCDFLVFSGHKMLGPTGIGVLYAHSVTHAELRPYQLGGGMVLEVTQEGSSWRAMPYMLEAGTQAASAAIGLGAALDYLEKNVDFKVLRRYEAALCQRVADGLRALPGARVLGRERKFNELDHLVSFTFDGIHPHDIAAYLDTYNIYVRAGNHCAQILHKKLGISGSVRVSFYLYNTDREVDKLIGVLEPLLELIEQKL